MTEADKEISELRRQNDILRTKLLTVTSDHSYIRSEMAHCVRDLCTMCTQHLKKSASECNQCRWSAYLHETE